jgi:hypothetical protein
VRNNGATTVGGVWVQSGTMRLGGTLFCGNGVNVNGAWTNLGGNQFNGQCPPGCVGDVNGNEYVDGIDLGEMLARWGLCEGTPCYPDFNGDGYVDGEDLGMLLAAWGPCPR